MADDSRSWELLDDAKLLSINLLGFRTKHMHTGTILRNMVVYLFVLTWLNHATTAAEFNKIVELQAFGGT